MVLFRFIVIFMFNLSQFLSGNERKSMTDIILPLKNNFIENQSILPLPINQLQYHGTTTLAFVFKDSIIVAVDSMASIGNYVGSRTVKKVFPLSNHIVATMAGGAADCTYWLRRVAAQAKIIEYDFDCELEPVSYARILAASLREFKGSDISIGTMIAGWHSCSGPTLHYVDSQGACVAGRIFSVGSGSSLAYSIIDAATANLTHYSLKEAVELAAWAVRHATYRDSYSGGFINVIHISADGCHHILRCDAHSMVINRNSIMS